MDTDKQLAVQEGPKFEVRDAEESKTVEHVSIRQLTDGQFLVEVSQKDDVSGAYEHEEYGFSNYAEVLDYLATIGS